MNEMFSQGGKGSTGILTNKQAVARHFGVKQSEVVYFSVGALLTGYKVIYDKASQRAYSLPADIGSGVTAVSLSPAGVLVHSDGNVDLGALAVAREEYVTLSGSFDTGVTVNNKNELVVFTDGKYRWDGALPKVVPAGSTPASIGGVGSGAWVSVGDASLRSDLSKVSGSSVIGGIGIYATNERFSGGVKGDGLTNDSPALKAAAEYATTIGAKVIVPPNLTVKLSGSEDITFTDGFDFNGSVIDISDYTGHIILTDDQTETVYDSSSSLVTAINSSSTYLKGDYWPTWGGFSELNNSFVRILTNQDWYQFRGSNVAREEWNIYLRDGKMEAPLMFELNPERVQQVISRPLPDKDIEYCNFTVRLGNQGVVNSLDNSWRPFLLNGNRLFIHDVTVESPDITYVTNSPVFMYGNNCAKLRIENVNHRFSFSRVQSGSAAYTYGFNLETCFDVRIKSVRGLGEGWGFIATHGVQRITFDSCQVTRIDFHHPFREWARVLNCDIGQFGVLVQAIGDLHIEGGSITKSEVSSAGGAQVQGFVTTRGDCGGFCYGNMSLHNVELRNFTNTLESPVFAHAIPAPSYEHPSGSPIPFSLWSSISYDNLSHKGVTSEYRANLMPVKNAGLPGSLKFVGAVTATDCVNGLFNVTSTDTALVNWTPNTTLSNFGVNPLYPYFNLNINLTNVALHSAIELTDTSGVQAFNVKLSAVNVYGRPTYSPNVILTIGGKADFTNCLVGGFNFTSGSNLGKPLDVSVNGGAIRHTGGASTYAISPAFTSTLAGHLRMSITGCTIAASNMSSLQSLMQVRLANNSYMLINESRMSEVRLTTDGATSYTFPFTELNNGNIYYLVTGNVGDSSQRYSAFKMPAKGQTEYVQITNDRYASVSRDSSGSGLSVTLSGGAMRYVAII